MGLRAACACSRACPSSIALMEEKKLRHLTLAAALSLSTCLSAPLAAQSTETAPMELTFERVFASPGLDGPTPRAVKLSPDGRYL